MGNRGFDEIWPTLVDARRDDSAPGLASVVRTIRPSPEHRGATLLQAGGAPTPARRSATRSLPRLAVSPVGAGEASGNAELELRGLLGEGGMGRVLLGAQRSLGRDVAVKTAHPGADDATNDALVTEGIVTGGLEHPNIVPIHLLGLDAAGLPVLVMKRVVGVSWGDLLADPAHAAWTRLPMLPQDRTRAHLEILMQVASALAFAHARGWVHRDLKPDNVMIGEFGEVYLMDWGLAARAGERIVGLTGTPAYMAPEMVQPNGVVDARTDVYLLGASLHHVLAGTPRHAGDALKVVLEAAWISAPVVYGADVPDELGALANRATAVDPAARPDGALAFRQAILDYLAHRSATSLAVVADERLAELEAALAAGGPELELGEHAQAPCGPGLRARALGPLAPRHRVAEAALLSEAQDVGGTQLRAAGRERGRAARGARGARSRAGGPDRGGAPGAGAT